MAIDWGKPIFNLLKKSVLKRQTVTLCEVVNNMCHFNNGVLYNLSYSLKHELRQICHILKNIFRAYIRVYLYNIP
jgi:hypothetical protein